MSRGETNTSLNICAAAWTRSDDALAASQTTFAEFITRRNPTFIFVKHASRFALHCEQQTTNSNVVLIEVQVRVRSIHAPLHEAHDVSDGNIVGYASPAGASEGLALGRVTHTELVCDDSVNSDQDRGSGQIGPLLIIAVRVRRCIHPSLSRVPCAKRQSC